MFASATFNFYFMIYGFEFLINKGTVSLKPCICGPKVITDTVQCLCDECKCQ